MDKVKNNDIKIEKYSEELNRVKALVTLLIIACIVYLIVASSGPEIMSQEYYQGLWHEAQNDLKKNFRVEARIKKKGPYKDLNTAKWLVGHLFMSYVGVVNRLDECYDQMVHPQKREVISRLLDLSLGRLLELKSEIVKIEIDDYCFFDNVLIELKLTHQDMEIHVPKYYWRDREKVAAHRRELMKKVFDEAEREKFKIEYLKNVPDDDKEGVWEKFLQKEEQQRLEKEKFEEQQRKMLMDTLEPQDSVENLKKELRKPPVVDKKPIVEAIELVQRHERARQGRIQAMLEKRKRVLKLRAALGEKISEAQAEGAAKVIQRHWRRHWRRVKAAKADLKLQDLLDMTHRSYKDTSKYERLDKVTVLRKKIQDRNQREYEAAFIKAKEKVTALFSIQMEEDTVDEIMAWFEWYFSQSGCLPDFPPEKPIVPTGDIMGIPKKLGPDFAEKLFQIKKKPEGKPKKLTALGIALAGISMIGGSALVVAGHWIGPKEFLKCQIELEKMKKAGKTGGDGQKKEKMSKEELKEMKKKQKEMEKRRLLAEQAEGFRLAESNFLAPLTKADTDYRVVWMDRDESKNPDQRYIHEFVQDEKCWELSMEIRHVVDEMMELELELLKEALERDKNPKKKPKKKKPKKPKKEKKKKGKKDPTGDRTLDDLFIELFRNGIIQDYQPVRLNEYLGERSYAAFDMRQRLIDWPPSTGDVRELILQLCILPLGSSRIHQLGPLTRSVCLLGMENSGKEFLARVICTETASVMFDLTPENVVGKYPGKDGLKMLQHLVEKMSRALQPSVILVDGAEKTFYKKVPKEEKDLDPKRLSGMITKVVKGIKPEDQVLVLGVSSRPWLANKNKMMKAFQKPIQIPQMDYGSYVRLWQDLLAPYHSVPRDFDVSCLARVSDGYSVKNIMDAVKNVLTTERVSKSRSQPYTQAEFLQELLNNNKPVDPKIVEKCLKFYQGLELPKKRAKKLIELMDELEKSKKKK